LHGEVKQHLAYRQAHESSTERAITPPTGPCQRPPCAVNLLVQ